MPSAGMLASPLNGRPGVCHPEPPQTEFRPLQSISRLPSCSNLKVYLSLHQHSGSHNKR